MKLLKKIKLNYNLKLLDDFISNKKYDDAYNLICETNEKDKLSFFLLLKNSQNLLTKMDADFYKKKIIWTISYDLSDISYIDKFLNYYLSKNLNLSFHIDNFASSLNNYFKKLSINEKAKSIEFQDFITQSNLYQNLLLFDSDKDYLFLKSCASFFETSQRNFFIHPNITFCYFYIINSPEKLFLRYKNKYGLAEAAYDELFNFNDNQYLSTDQKDQEFKVYENRKNINVNIKSWSDENVLSTYKGKIISYERLLGNTQDVLLEILYHLKQFGMNIEINLEDIKSFVMNNRIEENIDGNLSNNEKKFLEKNLN